MLGKRNKNIKRFFSILAVFWMANVVLADIHQAPWIAMQPDDSIVVPLVHSPFVKQRFGTSKPGLYTMPLLRRVFKLQNRTVRQATLQVCGLGHFECSIDGQKVGDHFLDPGWSDYRKSAEYVEFDVTGLLNASKTRKHVLGVMLGNGFYNIPRERYLKLLGSYGAPKLKLSLQITYNNGQTEEIVSDDSWQAAPGPVTFSSIYGGEDYDARLEQNGWNSRTGFKASEWTSAIVVQPAFEPALVKQQGTELKVVGTRKALSVIPTPQHTWIYDFGENLSGIVRLRIKEQPAGRTIRMLPAELIKADGSLNQSVARPYWFQYTSNGKPNQSWTPRFSYYGFRYVEVQGIHPDSIELEALHTSSCVCAAPVGSFRCSNDTLNRIHRLIDNAIRSNLASVPTDCPTREKLGWLEQDYLMLPSLLCRYDVKPLYHRLMQQIAEAQLPDGSVPTIAPYYTEFGWGFDDSPEWGAAFILAPWILYQHNADLSLIETYYPRMKSYMDYLNVRAREERDSLGNVSKPRHIIAYGLGDWYDLGPKGPGYSQLTPNGLTATATYFAEAQAMQKMASLLHRTADESYFSRLSDSIRSAYRQCYDTCSSQTALAMGLSLGLLPDSCISKAQALLLADLHKPHTTSNSKGTQHWSTLLTAGDIGYVYLVRTLAEMGEHQLLMQLCTRTDIPGYGLQLAKGATSLTESWQALENVSNNHLMLGHIMEWLYGYVGGIRPDFSRNPSSDYIVDPATSLPGIDSCQCTYRTLHGDLQVAWTRQSNRSVSLEVSVPEGCRVEVRLGNRSVFITSGKHIFR